MFKSQMKFQKILTLALLLFAALCFAFSLGISTDVYGLFLASAVTTFPGINIFNEMQPFNKLAVIFAIVLVVSCLLPYIFATNTRRLYYIDNYVSIGVQSALFVFYGIYVLINSFIFRTRFLTEVDFVQYKASSEIFEHKYSESTFFFDANIVLSVLCFVAVGLIIFNLIWKIKITKKEQELLSLGAQND